MKSHRVGRGFIASLAAVGVLLISVRADDSGQTDAPKPGAEQVQPMSRGPIHEGFAQPTVFDPKPGMVVPKEPPKPVEELTPEQKPEGENVAWIPGYWSWDAEASTFLWVSGTWRVMPPGRQWMPGYWKKVDNGHQWVSGFWAAAGRRSFDYLPTPPASLEIGPSSEPPGSDYIWSPGCWRWHDARYLWQAGCWTGVSPDWIWSPPCYNWTPSGCIYTDGFWDHSVRRRGLLFAPVCFNEPLYLNAGYYYSPRACVDLDLITDHFFCWPSYRHYCFGNFYSDFHLGCGISPWFSFSNHRQHRWCDPIYSHSRWDHGRRDSHWNDRVCRQYEHRRLNDHARPGIHHKDGLALTSAGRFVAARPALTMPIEHLAAKPGLPIKLEKVGADSRRDLGVKSADLQRLRDQRGQTESQASRELSAKPTAGAGRPHKLDLPASPIVARPGNDLGRPHIVAKPTESRGGGTGNIDLSRLRPESTPKGGEAARLHSGSKIEPRRDFQPGRFESTRIETRPRLESRPDVSFRPPSSSSPSSPSPRIETRSRVDSAPKFESSPRYSSAPRGDSAPRFSSSPRPSSSSGIRGGSSYSGGSRSSGSPSRSSGGGGGRGKK